MEIFEDIVFTIYKICTSFVPLLLFCMQLKRRKYFPVRIAAALLVFIGIEFLEKSVSFKDVFLLWHSAYNIAIFLIMSFTMWAVFSHRYFAVLYCCIAGKCVMHIAEYISMLIYIAIGDSIVYVGIAVSAVVYLAVYFVFARRITVEDFSIIDNKRILAFGFFTLCASDIITMDFIDVQTVNRVKIVVYLLLILVFVLVLCLQFGLFNESRIKQEAKIIEQLRVKESEQYEMSNEAIKLIGIKYHDIKALLESCRGGEGRTLSDEEIDSIKRSIDEYNIAYNTGNKTLDVILTEKLILCRQLNIKLECFVNGEMLGFMSNMDIYSLYLNALNNAIESVKELDDESKRAIWLKSYLNNNLLCIRIENFFKEEPKILHNDTIVTTKKDKDYHGFGLKSIKMVAEKYGGSMSVGIEDKLFVLAVVIPVPDIKTEKNCGGETPRG